MGMKTCTKCGGTKVVMEFHRRALASDGRAGECKACVAVRKRAWIDANPGRQAANIARWAKENPEKSRAIKSKWAKGHPDKVNADQARRRKANPGRSVAYSRKWQKAHSAQVNANNTRHRAKKLQATPAWANQFFIDEIYDLAQLRTKATGVEHQVDHIVPLNHKKVCGLHVEFNLRVIPAVINQKKGNRHWPDMPQQLGAHHG